MDNVTIEAKIADKELKEKVISRSSEKFEIFIEVDLPQRKITYEKDDLHSNKILQFPIRIEKETHEEKKVFNRRIRETRTFLEKLLEQEPHWIHSARAFIVEATGEQISEIVEYQWVKAILPNRELK